MSDSLDTTEGSGNENTSKSKFEMPFGLKEKLENIPEALEYIAALEKQLKKQEKKIKKIRAKLKAVPQYEDAGVQTDLPFNSTYSTPEEPKSIAEEIKEAAELATQRTGFVYDESSGMYYDSNTGYYYNADYGLYYDSNTNIYYSYNQETETYEFHSQAAYPPYHESATSKELLKRKTKSRDESKASKCVRLGTDSSLSAEAEEGECSLTSGNETSDESLCENSSDTARQWPPCMRIIVEQSENPRIKVGTLHMITFEGGTLGREGNHAVILPDKNISKFHLRFSYDKEKNLYFGTDLGSRNGTVLNGKRMSSSKQESEALEVAHGSRIHVGSVVLLCHVHEGLKTCGHCEPGLVQIPEKKEETVSRGTKGEQHKRELKKLRKKFGINVYVDGNTKLASGYTDRAQKRRETVGSQNPHEKTETASLTESISSQNKGFKMLAKMGWKEGQSLGKDSQGIVEPIPLTSNPGTSGMGSVEVSMPESQFDKNKQIIWKKTQERFKKLPAANIFEDSD